MKKFAGIAAVALAVQGVAWAQPIVIEPGEGPRGRAERSIERDTLRRAPAEAERGSPQRTEAPSRERRDVQSGQPRGHKTERSQSGEHEQTQKQRSAEPPSRGAQSGPREVAPNRNQERVQPGARENDRAGNRAQQDGRQADSPEKGKSAQPEMRDGPETARPQADSKANQSEAASKPQKPDSTPKAARPDATENSTSQRIAETIRGSIDGKEIRPVKDFGVSVTVGAQLPTRVDLRPLPREIATIRPQYRNFRYTVSESQIVIVDPGSRRIVEVIERDGGPGGGVDLYAVFEHKRDVRRWRRPETIVFQTGVVLPREAPLYALPAEIIEANPHWRGYQYVMTESDEVAIVEPRSHRIVEVIDKSDTKSAAANAPAAPPTSTASSPPLSDRHELAKLILQEAKPGEMQSIDGLKGSVLPSEVAIRPLPAEAEQRDPQLRGYQYTLIGDDVLIVDPQTRRVVDVIE